MAAHKTAKNTKKTKPKLFNKKIKNAINKKPIRI